MNPSLIQLIAEKIALGYSAVEIVSTLGKDKANIQDVNTTELSRALAEIDVAWNAGDLTAAGTAVVGDLAAALGAYVSGGGTPGALVEGLGTLTTIGVGIDIALSYYEMGVAFNNYEQNPNAETLDAFGDAMARVAVQTVVAMCLAASGVEIGVIATALVVAAQLAKPENMNALIVALGVVYNSNRQTVQLADSSEFPRSPSARSSRNGAQSYGGNEFPGLF
jgi:hypothetical protein